MTPRVAAMLVLTSVALSLGGAAALVAAPSGSAAAGLASLALHAVMFLVALALGVRLLRGRLRLATVLLGSGCVILGVGAAFFPALSTAGRFTAVYAHVAVGMLALAPLSWAGVSLLREPRGRWLQRTLVGGVVVLLGAYAAGEYRRVAWSPPRYDSAACYRFLTATTREQSGEPLFPSALRVAGEISTDCQRCHSEPVVTDGKSLRHGDAEHSRAYQRTYADFIGRRGAEAGVWCQGCHAPGRLASPDKPLTAADHRVSVDCAACHRATNVHALYGSAALELRGRAEGGADLLTVLLQRKRHSQETLRPDLHRASEFCGGCHRKNWNLPQNGYHWMPGPDELGQWQSSPFAPGALFAAGERTGEKSCLGCHDAHQPDPPRATPAMKLDLFVRRGKGAQSANPVERAAAPASGESIGLDVVVRNAGIGHDFPTGMPDLHDSWLEVIALDRKGQPALRSGVGSPVGAHSYRLVALDREGRPVVHGDLDRMVSASEWRRIPSGGADLARYTLAAPPGGLSGFRVRLLRRRRPEFSRWAGEPVQREPAVLAEVARSFPSAGQAPGGRESADAARWRHYGMALTSVKAFPEALLTLQRALTLRPNDPETLLCLGGVYLDEGDLLAAREQFQRAQQGEPARGRAWEGAVLRRMGLPDQASALLEPLARSHPRDGQLRFELGYAYLDGLRNAEAAREFEAMLDVDPIDVSAHYNLMLC
ncbi:MAG: tetratricopeptide repeat protein, partial [Actinomycetota bacterium]